MHLKLVSLALSQLLKAWGGDEIGLKCKSLYLVKESTGMLQPCVVKPYEELC